MLEAQAGVPYTVPLGDKDPSPVSGGQGLPLDHPGHQCDVDGSFFFVRRDGMSLKGWKARVVFKGSKGQDKDGRFASDKTA